MQKFGRGNLQCLIGCFLKIILKLPLLLFICVSWIVFGSVYMFTPLPFDLATRIIADIPVQQLDEKKFVAVAELSQMRRAPSLGGVTERVSYRQSVYYLC